MSKLLFPTVLPHLTTTNLFTQQFILISNYRKLLNYHIKYCGINSCWFIRSEIRDMMLSQSQYLELVNSKITSQNHKYSRSLKPI